MAEAVAGDVVQVCQHMFIGTMDTMHSDGPPTGKWPVQVRNIRCAKCGEEGVILDRNGQPIETTGFMVSDKATARASILASAGQLPAKKNPDPSLARSRINRDGLKAGTVAPDFRLPTVDGAEVALADYRGKRLLLVFIANHCPYCDKVAPDLQRLHESGFPVVAVTNLAAKSPESDRLEAIQKAEKLGLTFPVGMQKAAKLWMAYASFAAPAAYVIDADGVLETGVTTGAPAITALVEALTTPSS